ncbi:hypothetical protein CYMTET_39101 [Cymbomonas tetramitiformis]|uniref:Rhodanese domain-containing protein n=1 Tax=Cymbomonas tetramitiformis TaxID=36881 RepID=A0AAE0CCT8_9CHLO|nr:hypothetical protein CYMTET_39101 [Cymbomonas tetramitiformis]
MAQSVTEAREKIASMYEGYKKKFPDIPDLSAAELAARLEADNASTVLVDVRLPAEQAVSMIPGAITKEEFERDGEKFLDRPIVVYCTIGYRSGIYVQDLRARGYQAENLRGSILEWTQEGLPLVVPEDEPGLASKDGNSSSRTTKRVHVFGETWNLVGDEYEAVWLKKTPVLGLLQDFFKTWFKRFSKK